MGRQSRLVARRGILMQGAVLNGLIDCRNRSRQQFLYLLCIAGADGAAQILDCGPHAAAIAAIDFPARLTLAHSLFR